jgi:pimeloyl-ACP methyl ester carboxylesterase
VSASLRKGYVNAPHGQLHYAVAGTGPVLLLLAAAPRSHRLFLPLMELLADRFQLIALDQPGFGNSDAMPPGTTMEQLGSSMACVLDAMDAREADIFGIHTGGKIGVAIAAAFPARVRKLIVCGKSHSLVPDMQQRNAAMRGTIERYYLPGADPSGSEPLRAWTATWRNLCGAWWNDELFRAKDPDRFVRALEAQLSDELIARRNVLESYRANFEFDFAAAMSKVRAPTVVLEIIAKSDNDGIARQGPSLAVCAAHGRSIELPEIDTSGLFMHAGIEPIARVLTDVLQN